MEKYSLLSPHVRILTHKEESILCNLSNGKWIKIKKEILPLFKLTRNEFIKKCRALNISVKESNDFLTILDKYEFLNRYPTKKTLKNPLSIHAAYLNVTNECNLSCVHCYYEKDIKSYGLGMMDMVSVANSLFLSGIKLLTISGGEPLTRPDAKDLFKSIGEIGFKKITLLTNGLLVNKEMARIISSLGWDVRVSLEGHNEEINAKIRGKGSFQKTIKGIETLKEVGVRDIYLITTICNTNIKYLSEIESLANKLGINFGTSIFTPVGRGAKKLPSSTTY
ncbi:MAG: radical SAM protein [Patescibacteria group bacterium]